ncbi:MAG TPA: hypothetical protein DIW47_13470 [Bacteroidetes bacterium]|nr:hypothetical protein [Bacteroidota bacterium]
MRKTLLFLLTLLFFPHGSFGYEHLSSIYTNIVFSDLCNVREAPSVSAKIIGKVPQLTRVEICYGNRSTDTVAGEAGYWTALQFENQIGYLWHPNLAQGHFKSHIDTDVEFLIHFSAKKGLEIKAFRQNKLLIHKKFKRPNIDHLTGSTTFGKTFNSKGNEVFAIAYNDSLYELFEWNGTELKPSVLKLNDESLLTGKYTHYPYGYINTNDVRLRVAPDSGAVVLATLPAFSKVMIIEPDSVSTVNRTYYHGFWQKVKWDKGFAYVWSEYVDLPIRYIKSNKKENEAFLYSSGGIYVLSDDKIAFQLPEKTYGLDEQEHFIDFGNRGLEEKYQILSACVNAYSCGSSSGDMLYVWNGSKLKFLYFDGGVGDGGLSEYFSLIFPTDPGGIKGKLVKYDAYSESDDAVLDNRCENYGTAFMSEIYSIMEFNGDTLVELPGKHFQVKQFVKAKYPEYQLMHYRFFDGNKDGVEDVAFFLQISNYEHPEKNKTLIGIAFGTLIGTFDTCTVNLNMVKKDFFVVQFNPQPEGLEIVIKYNIGYYAGGGRTTYDQYLFTYDKELKTMVWRSLTSAEGASSDGLFSWQTPETEYFKTNRIRFENVW